MYGCLDVAPWRYTAIDVGVELHIWMESDCDSTRQKVLQIQSSVRSGMVIAFDQMRFEISRSNSLLLYKLACLL